MELKDIQKILIQFQKRAENKPDEIISSTFVDAEPLIDILQAPVSQVIFGRRGTGKTHALKYCLSTAKDAGDVAVFLDIRSIGSNGSYYGDGSIPQVERGLRLVSDILQALLDELYPYAIQKIDEGLDGKQITLRLDDFTEAIGNVKIIGEITYEDSRSVNVKEEISGGAKFEADPANFKAAANVAADRAIEQTEHAVETVQGVQKRSIDFAQTQVALDGLIKVLGIPQMWLFLDEWSETPRDVQPYLADLVRKTILPIGKVIVKIGAIEQRSNFVIKSENREYIGLELGADISADLNLDEFLVFDFNEDKAIAFFRELIFKNFVALSGGQATVTSASGLSNLLFTEKRAVEEFTRAVEGVPRDAINLASRIVTKAFGRKAGVDDVRRAALDWYSQDKFNVVSSNMELEQTLNHIIDEVIGNRKARAFLFPANYRHQIIDALYDARVIHLLKKNVSSRDEPGKRYDVWKIDYGCYVDLIKTQNAPQGLLPEEDEGAFVEVPSDDYRSIRRAVLSPDDLEKYSLSNG